MDTQKLRADIKEVGWHVIMVPRDEEGPSFAYSIGLHENFAHPEILILGLDLHVMHRMINSIGEEVKKGMRFAGGKRYPGVLEGYDCLLLRVKKKFIFSYLAQALFHYESCCFEALQCVWPDKEGRFPGENGFPDSLLEQQRLVALPLRQRLRISWKMRT